MNATDLCACGGLPATEPNRDCERCCLVWFAFKVDQMRAAQKQFFKTRRGEDLRESRRLEKLIDAAIVRLNKIPSQQELF